MRVSRMALVLIPLVLSATLGGWGPAGADQAGATPAAVQQLPGPGRGDIVKGRQPRIDEGSVLVQFEPARSLADIGAVLGEHGLERRGATRPAGFIEVPTRGRPASDVRKDLQADPRVKSVEPNFIRRATATPNDPSFPNQRPLIASRFPEAWNLQPSAPSVTVAVLDTGVDLDHPDLVGQLVPGWDAVAGDSLPQDENGHGTMVAGIIGATADNARGIAGGAYRTRIQPVRVLDAQGSGTDADIIEGITWAAANGADVINLSLAGPEPSSALGAAVAAAQAQGVLVIAASGNASGPEAQYPAALPQVLAVGATDGNGALTFFSSHGAWLDLAAVGVNVLSTTLGSGAADTYAQGAGTSFSAPVAAAAAALVIQAHPTWTATQVSTQLTSTARDAGPPGHDDGYGFGFLDVYAALGGPALGPLASAAGDGREPNPVPDQASILTGVATGTIGPELDVDWFAVDVVGPRWLTTKVTPGNGAAWQKMDPTITVYGPDGAELASVDVAGPGEVEGANIQAGATGRYRVRVGNYNASLSASPYEVAVTASTEPPAVPGPFPTYPTGSWLMGSLWVYGTSPLDGLTPIAPTAPLTVTFGRAMDPASLTTTTTALLDGSSLAPIAATRSYDAATRRLTLTPQAPLAPGGAHQLVINGVRDTGGARMLVREVVRFRTTGTAVPSTPAGYWMAGSTGTVYGFGASRSLGNMVVPPGQVATGFAPTPSGNGYFVVTSLGRVGAFGDAVHRGEQPPLRTGETVRSISVHPGGLGYWLFTSQGRVFPFGSVTSFGDLSAIRLTGPVLGSVATPSGNGYYMVASDGGIFAFGDARFRGSMGGQRLNAPVVGLAPNPDGLGYWLVASDGGIFAFDSPFRGSTGNIRLNRPVIGMVAYGNGYLMVASDGGIFSFSDKPFLGSLGASPPPNPIAAVGALST